MASILNLTYSLEIGGQDGHGGVLAGPSAGGRAASAEGRARRQARGEDSREWETPVAHPPRGAASGGLALVGILVLEAVRLQEESEREFRGDGEGG